MKCVPSSSSFVVTKNNSEPSLSNKEWNSPAGAQVSAIPGSQSAQVAAAGLAPSAYSQQVANLANAQLASLQAQQIGGIPATHMAQYGSHFQAAGLAGLQMAIPAAPNPQTSPPPASHTPELKKKIAEMAAPQIPGLVTAG